jgi:adenylate kinase family enzyme
MERIQICGGPGAGKSTLAGLLGERLNLRYSDLDDLYWDPGWREATPAQFHERIADAISGRRWVLAGNYLEATASLVWPRLTMLIVLDLPLPLRMTRLVRRAVGRRLTRQTCCNGNAGRLTHALHHDGVLRYSLRTSAERRAAYASWPELDALRHVNLVHLRSPAEVAAFVAHIEHRTVATILAR